MTKGTGSISSNKLEEVLSKQSAQMAPSSPFRMITRQHTRSFSLTSSNHPVLTQFNQHLSRLGETEATPNSLSSLGHRLSGLEDLYVSLDDLIQMPHIQQSLASVHESNKKVTDDVLDTYIKILDACTTTKDIFSQAKQDVQELLSSLRRKKDTTDAFGMYLASGKKAKKTILKALKHLKNVKISEGADELEAIRLFKNVQSVTTCVLESSLSYVMGKKAQSSLVSKIMHKKCKEASENEFDQINEALGVQDTESIQRQLREMELRIQDIEEVLDRLFKHLIKTRVSFLNILSY